MITHGSIDLLTKRQKVRSALKNACIKADLPANKHDEIIEKGLSKFMFEADGTIKPLSKWQTPYRFVQSCRYSIPQSQTDSTNPADLHKKSKGELFEQLYQCAETSDMASYRQVRSAYLAK